MNHNQIIQIVSKWIKKHKNNLTIPNCSVVASDLSTLVYTGERPDIIAFDYCRSILIEVKISRSDFLKDRKKKFRIDSKLGMGEYRYYCCKTGLIMETELPKSWGLIYINEKGEIEIIKKADELENNTLAERSILLSIIRRNKIKN